MDLITTRGLRMPRLGLGTGLLRKAPGQASIELALSLGFRHRDTAEMDTNEGTVSAAIARLPKDGRVVNADFAPVWDAPEAV